MINKSSRTATLLTFFFLSLLIPSLIKSTINAADHQQNPNAAERAIGLTPPVNPWMTIRSWFKLAWMNIRSPDSLTINKEASNSGEFMKEAVSKSFETSKETAKKTAKVAGDAIHKTAEKVMKKTISNTAAAGKSSMDKNQQEL